MGGVGQCEHDDSDGGVRRVHVMEEDADVHPDGDVCSGDHRQTNNHSVSTSL